MEEVESVIYRDGRKELGGRTVERNRKNESKHQTSLTLCFNAKRK